MEQPGASAPISTEERRNLQVDNAIRAIQQKKPLPEIDFSIHTMEDGTQVSTMERVCKGTFSLVFLPGRFASSRLFAHRRRRRGSVGRGLYST